MTMPEFLQYALVAYQAYRGDPEAAKQVILFVADKSGLRERLARDSK
jgi:hypothetical protein